MSEILEAVKSLNETFHQFKAKNDERLAEIEKSGSAPAELEAQVKQMAEAMANIETKLNRPAFDKPGDEQKSREEAAGKAFGDWLRRGEKGMTPESLKLLSVGDDTQAGYLAPVQMVNQMIIAADEISELRSVATVINTNSKAVEIPKETGQPEAEWAGDGQDVSATNATYGVERIDANELVAVTDVTWSMLEDAGVNLAQFIQSNMARRFAIKEGRGFVSGNGVKKPQGLLAAAGLVEYASGDSNKITADAITALAMKALKSEYSRNGVYALNRSTLFDVYTLKDGQGQYLYRPNQDVGRPPTIQGRPYIEMPDLPNAEAGTYPILFGDFRRGYVIVDRQAVSIYRDESSQSSKRIVRFVGSKRVGGAVVLPEAIAKLKIATSV